MLLSCDVLSQGVSPGLPAVHPQDEGQTWQETHLWRQEADKGGHGSRSISREMR